jgi:tetratricopeptide (TPR) repeat protein
VFFWGVAFVCRPEAAAALRVGAIMWRPGRRASSLLIRGGRWSSLADTQITLGKFDDAIASLQSALSQMADDSPTQSLATVNLAKAYAGLGKMEQARSYCR